MSGSLGPINGRVPLQAVAILVHSRKKNTTAESFLKNLKVVQNSDTNLHRRFFFQAFPLNKRGVWLCFPIYIYTWIFLLCVKIVPFHPKNVPKGRHFTSLEDPGIHVFPLYVYYINFHLPCIRTKILVEACCFPVDFGWHPYRFDKKKPGSPKNPKAWDLHLRQGRPQRQEQGAFTQQVQDLQFTSGTENGWLEYDPFLLEWPIFRCFYC